MRRAMVVAAFSGRLVFARQRRGRCPLSLHDLLVSTSFRTVSLANALATVSASSPPPDAADGRPPLGQRCVRRTRDAFAQLLWVPRAATASVRLLMSGMPVVLGVSLVAGALTLTDTLGKVFDNLFLSVNAETAVEVRGHVALDGETGPRGQRKPY